ncbi:hypothetical protein [Frigidibacter sp. MR17.24]|uniref:hypothetical protein n=1 Tax=Frigidibacter sp. MR17.24 TaxID=3127345 RepID=UPI003012F67D
MSLPLAPNAVSYETVPLDLVAANHNGCDPIAASLLLRPLVQLLAQAAVRRAAQTPANDNRAPSQI